MNDVLIILEGKRPDRALVEKIENVFSSTKPSSLSLVTVGCDIYELYTKMIDYDSAFASSGLVDIEDVLKTMKTISPSDILKLNRKYPFKYLFFDFDFQDTVHPTVNKQSALSDMIMYFSDETENGLMLINYPMIESYRDCAFPCDDTFMAIEIEQNRLSDYKKIVAARGNYVLLSKYDVNSFLALLGQSIKKANLLVTNDSSLCDLNSYRKYITQRNVLDAQFARISLTGKIFVLNSSVFFIIEFFGSQYYPI
jgi:hypothetical protein